MSKWCGRRDSNSHGCYPTATSTLRVYHSATTARLGLVTRRLTKASKDVKRKSARSAEIFLRASVQARRPQPRNRQSPLFQSPETSSPPKAAPPRSLKQAHRRDQRIWIRLQTPIRRISRSPGLKPLGRWRTQKRRRHSGRAQLYPKVERGRASAALKG